MNCRATEGRVRSSRSTGVGNGPTSSISLTIPGHLSVSWEPLFYFDRADQRYHIARVEKQYIRMIMALTWHPSRVAELGSLSSGAKNGNENFCQARIYNFRVKCVVFARNRIFAKLTQWNMQYIPCNSALLAQETLFLTQKGTFFAQRSPKSA